MSEILYSAPRRVAEIKSADGGMEVAGYVSTFGNVDFGGDIVQTGAFAKSLGARTPVRFLFGHDSHSVLGKPLELREDEKGLFGRFAISQTTLGKDIHTLLVDGALDSFSIGYIPTDVDLDEKGVRLLKEVDLLECSVVAMPMNARATVTAVKDLDSKDWHIEKREDQYCVIGGSSGDRNFGCHASRADAIDHMRALYANVPDAGKKLGEFFEEHAGLDDLIELRGCYAELEHLVAGLIEQRTRPAEQEVKHMLNRLALLRARRSANGR